MAGERLPDINSPEEKRYIDALSGSAKALGVLSPDLVQIPIRERLIAWGRVAEKAAVVASSSVYEELMQDARAVDNRSIRDQGYNSTIHGTLLDTAYRAATLNGTKTTPSQRVNDSEIGYFMTVPNNLIGIPYDQITKRSFVENLASYTFTDSPGKTVLNEEGEERTVITQAVDARKSMAGIRNNILGWVRSGKNDVLKRRYKLDIDGVNSDILANYTEELLLNPNADGGSIFCINPETLERINDDISNAEGEKKVELEKVKRVLGGLSHAIFTEIDNRIGDNKLEEIEQIMRNQINFVDGDPTQKRDSTIIMLNGHTGAGKGTTLGKLKAKAVETGTDGIAGRGEGYSQYEQVMGPFDMARATGEYIPTKVMKLLFATEMLSQRQELDSQGRYNEPVYVSGYPRTPTQAATLSGINNVKSVALIISEETAVVRTLTRIAMSVSSGQQPREDDLNDLDFSLEFDGSIGDYVADNINMIAPQLTGVEEIEQITRIVEGSGMNRVLKMSAGSRYFKYDKVIKGDPEKGKDGIDQVLQKCDIKTTYIECDGKSPNQVTDEVKEALGLFVAA